MPEVVDEAKKGPEETKQIAAESQDDHSIAILSDALDGNTSVIRPLILAIIVYVSIVFVLLVSSATNTDRDTLDEHKSDVAQLLNSHMDLTTKHMNNVAPTIASLSRLEVDEGQRDLSETLLRLMQARPATSQAFVLSPTGDILSAHATETPAPGVTADEFVASAQTMKFVSERLGTATTDLIAVGSEVYLVTLLATPCGAYENACSFVSVSNLDSYITNISGPFFPNAKFAVSSSKPTSSELASLEIYNRAGDVVGWFRWNQYKPGLMELYSRLPWLSVLTAIVLLMCYLVWRRGKQVSIEILKRQHAAQHRALHDPLTGLANRTLMNARLAEAAASVSRSGKGFALHLIDLDHFKNVNDTLGHQAGDELLKEAAERLKSVCRVGDTVARLGGDEFAIIQCDVGRPNAAARLARRANEKLAAAYNLNGTDVFISGSIGVAVTQQENVPVAEHVRQADIALYRAKGAGRNQFCFFEREMDQALQERSVIEADLRAALEKNELNVVFQPQVSADGRHIRGMEALVRWRHPERGVVPPSVFVPVAEETGLIRQLGEFVMRESFATALQWPEITMAVNVSAGELHHNDYASRVIALAEEMGVRTDQIELEITETVLLEDSARVTRTIKALKSAGFRIALDDFGTGYSSLSYLRRHQVDKLKIDQSFVSSIGVRDDAGAVVQAIIHLGEALGLSVTAEGVETEVQRDALKARGCAYLQGYLFSRPIAADQIGELIEAFTRSRKMRESERGAA